MPATSDGVVFIAQGYNLRGAMEIRYRHTSIVARDWRALAESLNAPRACGEPAPGYREPDELSANGSRLWGDLMHRGVRPLEGRQDGGLAGAILDSLPGVFYLYDEDLRFLRWNREFTRVTGYSDEEMTRLSPLDLFAGADKELLRRRIAEVFSAGASTVEADFVTRDGQCIPYYFTGVRTQIGDLTCLMGVGIDISQRTKAESALRDSEERLRLALNAAHMGTFDWDLPADHITWSRWHEEMWGLAPGEYPGTYAAFAGRIHPEDLPGVDAEVERCLAERDRFQQEFRVVWPDGSIHWVMGRGEFTFSGDGTALRMRGVVVETTERRRIESALRQSEEHHRVLFEQAPIGIFVSEADGRHLLANTAGCRLVGYTLEELNDLSVADLLMPDEVERLAGFVRTLSTDRTTVRSWRFRRKDCSCFHGEVAVKRLADGRLQAFLTDITERFAAEQEVRDITASLERRVVERTAALAAARDRAEQSDRLKSAFLSTMSHELRTPLNSVIGFTGILLQDLAGPLNDEQRKQLGMVQRSARHLLSLINDVLDLSKIEAGHLTVAAEGFAVDRMVDRVVATMAPLAEEKALGLRLEAARDLGEVISDERRVEQVLLNLLGNAIKFTEHGEVVLGVEPVAAPWSGVRFTVSDTGIGMEPDALGALFQPFRQLDVGLARQHDGTGLGLAICRRLADLLRGRIEVCSQPGVGSTFTFTLPTVRE
jgi:PAS domain S-box-containing protein